MPEDSTEPAPDNENLIRERAYHLWEADGCPEGRAHEYWVRAKESMSSEGSATSRAAAEVAQADVAAARGIAERAGNQQQTVADPQDTKDR